jgi:pyruvate/2-oxoglutarate dehydrogenase complex dihydrolipoamide acyltransferase (E2) component
MKARIKDAQTKDIAKMQEQIEDLARIFRSNKLPAKNPFKRPFRRSTLPLDEIFVSKSLKINGYT